MSNRLHAGLSWLPTAPEDFSVRCRALAASPETAAREARWLAGHALDENQLHRLVKAMTKVAESGVSLAPLTRFRLGIVSNATSHLVVPALVGTALRHGIWLDCVEADYGQTVQAALDPGSVINRHPCDAVLIAIDHRGLPLTPTPGDRAAATLTLVDARNHLELIRDGLHRNGQAVCILQTLPPPVERTFGSFDRRLPGSERWLIDEANRDLAERVENSADLLLDVAHIAETVGLGDWHDPTLWNMAKLPFSSEFLPLYADHVCRLVAALRGKSKKCLILDLDNTIWGGVIGDDGLDGILLGQGDATGEAHVSVQRSALSLRARGVLLAVSSKNTDEIARRPFREHPEMLLHEDHIAVFQANWNDKATNIKAIAEELSLGLDSMVFLDDNPVERNLVRRLLPQVAVPELPEDPALYARTLLAAGYFEAIAFSTEDRQRAEQYQDNARRVQLKNQAGDVDAYLASLEMVMTLQPFDDNGRARIAQLINKSNQFNLTTRRYTEADVAAAQRDPEAFTLQVRLTDKFGDNGMISVVICRKRGDDWDIDTWLMSCRVLGRKVENAVLSELLEQAGARGIRRLVGNFIPTEKNQLVAEHYEKLGFQRLSGEPGATSQWELEIVAASVPANLPVRVERSGFDAHAANSAPRSEGSRAPLGSSRQSLAAD